MEEELRQAQEMEAVGRLAGWIAHDFNNLLMVLIGHADLLLAGLSEGDPLRLHAQDIRKAAARAAALTKRLLAFSRKQVLQSRILDLNTVVAGIEGTLRRVIGPDVTLVTHPGPTGWVKADPAQLEQVIMSLAVNAREAMPRGGRLTLETARVEVGAELTRQHPDATPGSYMALIVGDTGSGMTAEVRDRLFEPFFTTKEEGKGTGLGLTIVYGIVRQHGGFILVDSAPGQGSRFRVYLPVVEHRPGAAGPETPTPPEAAGGSETILVVEDEAVVRDIMGAFLSMCGYAVLEASGGEEALRLARQHPGPIHLALTDVAMPGMSGPDLVERLAALRPGVKAMYMSGYSRDEMARREMSRVGGRLLQKPFTQEALLQRVREVLDRRTPGERRAGQPPHLGETSGDSSERPSDSEATG